MMFQSMSPYMRQYLSVTGITLQYLVLTRLTTISKVEFVLQLILKVC